MAKKAKQDEVVEAAIENKEVESTVGGDKIRVKKPAFSKNTDEVIKLDLREFNKPKEEVITKEEEKIENVIEQQPVGGEPAESKAMGEKSPSSESQQENKEQISTDGQDNILEEITDEQVVEKAQDLKEEIKEAVANENKTGQDLPENIQKVVDFIKDTGGTLEDYVKLNQDFTSLDENQVLREYYKSTKPHLDNSEIDFLIEDSFLYDEDIDDERDIRRKKLALKEQVAYAKTHLDGLKSRYYDEIKAGSRLTPEQQKAVDFFNRYNKEAEEKTQTSDTQKSLFLNRTNEVFSNEFKGFEYNVGDKRYRFNVKDVDKVKTTQSDINNFVRKFLNEKNEIVDAKGYHKSLFTAMNSDAIANHFYEQGKSDAIKDSIARGKNIDMAPRQGHEGFVQAGGIKVRVLDADNSSSFKFKIKK
tara:strand:+ start:532 stop:1785 length:1254 start_codon:yes stop_codon:yes gene_type:complete